MDQSFLDHEQTGDAPERSRSRRAVVPTQREWDDRGAEPPPGWNIAGFLWRRRVRITVIAAVCMVVLTAAIFLIVPTYRASSMLIFQGDAPGATQDDGQREPAFAADTLSNEIELLTSEELLAKVVMSLDLINNPRFTAHSRLMPARFAGIMDDARTWMSSRIGVRLEPTDPSAATLGATRLSEAIDVLRSRLSIVPVGLSRVIRITAQAHDARLAATLANAVAVAYADARAQAKVAVTREAHAWIENRLTLLHDRAQQSARAYDAFRHANGAIRGKDGTFSQEQMSQIGSELTQARALHATLQSTLAQVSGSDADPDGVATASVAPLLSRLREQLAVASAREAELTVRGGAKLPSLVANRAEIADIRRSIAREVGRVRAAVSVQLAVAVSNENRLTQALEKLKPDVEAADAGGAQMRALEQDAAADDAVYRRFVSRAEQTDPELAYQTPSVRILSRAVAPLSPSSPNKPVMLPLALLISLGVGTAFALMTERSRRGVLTLRDLPRPSGRAPLGMLPSFRRGDRKMTRVWQEAVAHVLARMLLPPGGSSPASILVTSALPREGKTRFAIALAAAATKRRLRVLLVDADLRCQTLTKEAALARSEGNLVRLLEGEIGLADAITFHDGWGFAVLPAGVPHGSPLDLLTTPAWEIALRGLETMFDLVIIDTPPVLAAGDTWMMGRCAAATAIVAEWAVTPAAAIELAVGQLLGTNAKVLGVILTKVAASELASYGLEDAVMFSPQLLRYHSGRGQS